jgi:hypothetical protein
MHVISMQLTLGEMHLYAMTAGCGWNRDIVSSVHEHGRYARMRDRGLKKDGQRVFRESTGVAKQTEEYGRSEPTNYKGDDTD